MFGLDGNLIEQIVAVPIAIVVTSFLWWLWNLTDLD